MLCALIDKDGKIVRVEDSIDPNVLTKPGFKWLPLEDIARPVYDPNTQFAKQTVIVKKNKVIRNWSIRNKTEEEINDDKAQKINTIDPILLQVLFSYENKLRSLQKNKLLSFEEYKSFLKDLL